MTSRRQSAAHAASLIATLFAGAWMQSGIAAAQTRLPETATGQRPGGFVTTVRPTGRGASEADPAVTVPDPNADPDATPDPNAMPGDDDGPRLRRRPLDGDMNWPPQPQQPVDGVLQPPEETAPVDGVDPAETDTRDPEDIAAFERPAAGFDPEAFTAEIEPILDRRPARLARFEPFQPVGIRVGSFTVFPEAEFAFGAYDNLFRSSSNVRRDIALDFRPSFRAVSNWRTHALEFRATGLTTFHNEFPSEDDRAYLVESRGRVDITRRTNIEALVSTERTQEIRGSINAVAGTRERADIDTQKATLAFNHRFNHLSIQLRAGVTETDYGAVRTETGEIATNADRDNTLRETAARATWMFKPTFGVFSEVVLNQRDYRVTPADGIRRDSTGDRTRAGMTFGTTSQILRGEVAVGYANQRYEDDRLRTISGVILDANLAWRVSGLTSLLFTARSDVTESILVGASGALSQQVGVEARHSFRRDIIGTAAVQLTKQDYQGVELSEHSVTTQLGLEYFINREVTLFGRYQHVDFESTLASRNYNYDEVRIGVRVRR